MSVVTARPVAGRSVDVGDFVDVTSVAVESVAWGDDGLLVVTFDGELTTAEQQRVIDRIESRNGNEETIRAQARAALDGNRAFIDTTAGQLVSGADAILANSASSAQEKDLAKAVKALTNQTVALSRQNIKIVRVLLGMLDGTD